MSTPKQQTAPIIERVREIANLTASNMASKEPTAAERCILNLCEGITRELQVQCSLAPARGSASGATFQKLFEDARKSPIYYLEGLDIECGETLILLKANLKRVAYYNHEKQQYIKGQIQATRHHLKQIRKVMCECEKMPNSY